MKKYVIGLTGGISCGKSNISDALKNADEPGCKVTLIDADAISRGLTQEGGEALPAIRKAFGDAVFDGEKLNRKKLGQIVFESPEQLKKLNELMHPLIFRAMRRALDSAEGIALMDVPLLFETGIDAWCDEIWCVYLPQKEQVKRLCARDHITRREALARIHAQMPALEKARRSHRVIRTEGTPQESAAIALRYLRETVKRLEQEEA